MRNDWIIVPLAFVCVGCVPVEPVAVSPSIQQPITALPETEPSPVTARLIGSTVAEVDSTATGMWLAMDGIDRAVPGWITDQETGVSAQVDLRPLQGDGIDQISFDALSGLGIREARLVIVDVYYDVSALRVVSD